MGAAWVRTVVGPSADPDAVGDSLAECLLQVPANRIGYTTMNLGQLKILQEVIAVSVFVPLGVRESSRE